MKIHRLAIALSILVLSLAVSLSAESKPGAASIQILKPADQAQLDAGESYPLDYQVTLGQGDDHFHVWVDEERSPGIHDLKGTYMLPKMTPVCTRSRSSWSTRGMCRPARRSRSRSR